MLGYLLNHVIEFPESKLVDMEAMVKEFPELQEAQEKAVKEFGLQKLEPLFGGSATELMVEWIINPHLTICLKDSVSGEVYFVTHGNPDGSFTFATWEGLADIATQFGVAKVNLVSCYNGMRQDCVVNGVEFVIPETTKLAAPSMMLPKNFAINDTEEFCFFSSEIFNDERFIESMKHKAWIRDALIQARELGR